MNLRGLMELIVKRRHPGVNPVHVRALEFGRVLGRRHYNRSRWLPHQSLRERTRRMKQFPAAG